MFSGRFQIEPMDMVKVPSLSIAPDNTPLYTLPRRAVHLSTKKLIQDVEEGLIGVLNGLSIGWYGVQVWFVINIMVIVHFVICTKSAQYCPCVRMGCE